MSRKRRRTTIITAAAASVAAGVALIPNWSAGAQSVEDPTVDQATEATFQRLADAVFTQRTDALLDTGGQQDEQSGKSLSSRFHGDVRVSSGLNRKQKSAVSSLQSRKSRLAALGEKYSAGKTTVTLDATKVSGRHATAQVTETTTLTYKKVRGDQPRTTGFQAHHKLTFTADRDGNWQLTGIKATDGDDDLAVNQPTTSTTGTATGTASPSPSGTASTTAATEATPAATTYPAATSNKKNLTSGAYDYKAMAAYAEKYWSTYNSAYPDYNGNGGDCTNFVSQAMKAGGWKEITGSVSDPGSWFTKSSAQSTTWVGVNEFSEFALNSKRVTSLSSVYQLDVGDVLQMDFDNDGEKDHTMIVTYRDSAGVPYVTYHSTNTYRRSVASLVAAYPNAKYYAYRT